MRDEMTMQAPRQMHLMESECTNEPTILECLAVYAAKLTQKAHEDVRRYEAACAALGTGTNPRETPHDLVRAERAMLYGKYLMNSIEAA